MVRSEVESVGCVLPIRDQGGHVVIHGQVGILVDLPANETQVPAPVIVGVLELGEVERHRRGHDEEVPHPRVVIHEPVRRSGKEDPVISPSPGIVVLLRRGWKDHPGGSVRVDVEDGHERSLRDPVIDPDAFPPAQERLLSPVQPDSGLQRVRLILLGLGFLAHAGAQKAQRQTCRHPESEDEHVIPPVGQTYLSSER
jgi:hypothetical protein